MGDEREFRHNGEADRPGDAQIAASLLAHDTRDLRCDKIRRNDKRRGEQAEDNDGEQHRQANQNVSEETPFIGENQRHLDLMKVAVR